MQELNDFKKEYSNYLLQHFETHADISKTHEQFFKLMGEVENRIMDSKLKHNPEEVKKLWRAFTQNEADIKALKHAHNKLIDRLDTIGAQIKTIQLPPTKSFWNKLFK